MFQIGEFSKIAQVSGRLLRYYEEIGLLSPEFTDPQTGYRYYSAQQLPRLNRILVLKELGLSLEQIAHLLDQETSADEMRGMLILRKAQIEQTLQEEMARLRAVETRLQQIETSGQIQEPDVVLKAIPAQPFLALRTVLPGLAAIRRLELRIAASVPAAVGHHSLSNIAMVVHSPVFDPEALDVEVGYLLTGKAPQSVRLSQEQTLTLRTLPAIETMATLVHTGSPGEIHRSYGALGTWIEHHGWQISGVGRHTIMHLSPVEEEEEVVVEVQLPVTKLDASSHFISVSTAR
jgi:DNA-binding transcriptional MerR regulator